MKVTAEFSSADEIVDLLTKVRDFFIKTQDLNPVELANAIAKLSTHSDALSSVLHKAES